MSSRFAASLAFCHSQNPAPPNTHGSKFHREAVGTGTINPQHTFKNVKMPGRMGFRRVTVQNLKVVKVDPELNVILVRGAVPGNKDCTLIVKSAVKK